MDIERQVVEGMPVDLVWADATRTRLLFVNVPPLPDKPQTEALVTLTLVRRGPEGEAIITKSLHSMRDLGCDLDGRPTIEFLEPFDLRPGQEIDVRLSVMTAG